MKKNFNMDAAQWASGLAPIASPRRAIRRWSRRLAFCAALALAALVAFPATAVRAQDLPASVKALIPAAKKEGGVNVFGYTSNPRQEAAFRTAISKFYGFQIDINFHRGNHVQETAQLVQAAQNHVPTNLDIFWSGPTTVGVLEKAGAMMKFDWAKTFGLDPALQIGDTGLRSHDSVLASITYNTSLVKAEDVPKSYDDLLDPKWKGRLSMPRSPTPWFILAYALGDEKVTDLLTRVMHDAEPKILPTYPDVRTRVSTGEFALGFGADGFVLHGQGAPIDEARASPIVLLPSTSNILADVAHPNLAKLWGYWLVTPDGQRALVDILGYALVTTKGSPLYDLAQKTGKVEIVSDEFTQKNFEPLGRKYSKIMGIR
jgi:iron(III) transport system substrate-binding protein